MSRDRKIFGSAENQLAEFFRAVQIHLGERLTAEKGVTANSFHVFEIDAFQLFRTRKCHHSDKVNA